jgi:hypothetical protein
MEFNSELGRNTNSGFEMLISGSLIKTQNIKWTSSFNFSNGKVATNATNSDINLGQARSQNVQISHVGQPYGVIWNVICEMMMGDYL